jgi:hypothetical protein
MLMRKHGWNIGGNHNMGSQAALIVMQTIDAGEKQPDIKVKTMLGRNALDSQRDLGQPVDRAWRASWRQGDVRPQLGDLVAARRPRRRDAALRSTAKRLDSMQPVKTLVEAGNSGATSKGASPTSRRCGASSAS